MEEQDHEHDHEHGLQKNLKLAIILTFIILIAEVIGGLISNSLALLSDAAHVLTDGVALLLTYGSIRISMRPSGYNTTFGYHRFEIFAALTNGFTILGISVLIFYEAYTRITSPAPPVVNGVQMTVVAIIGLAANFWVALKLHGHGDLNIKGAYLHVLGDLLASVAVIAGGVVILFKGYYIIDPILSFLITAVLLYGAIKLISGAARILLEFAPGHIKVETLVATLSSVEGVHGVHDIHVWSICSNIHAMSAHILVDRIHVKETEKMITAINELLHHKFRITHTTLQFECAECGEGEIGSIGHVYEHDFDHR